MGIELLFDLFGVAGTLIGLVVGVALPLLLVGHRLRRRGGTLRARWRLIEQARVAVRDVARGRVAVTGIWRHLDEGRGLLEDGAARVIVAGAGEQRDGASLLVVGWVTRTVDDPGADYRRGRPLWLVEGDGPADPLTVYVDGGERMARWRWTARWRLRLGAALLASGVAVAVAGSAICYRAAGGGELIVAGDE